MRYSIIIPVYNAENTIKRCLDSILNKTFKDYEIIIINDGSCDNSLSICNEYLSSNNNITVIDKENGGASSARNAGIDVAKGEYILFIDSDDYVEDNFFDVLVGNETKDGLSVFTNYAINNKRSRKREIKDMDDDFSLFEKSRYLIESRTINGPMDKVFDRHLINKMSLRYNEEVPVAEDFLFGVKYLMNCSNIKISNIGIYMCDQTNQNSLSRGKKKNLINIYYTVFDEVFDEISNSKFSNDEKQELFQIWDKLHTDSFVTCVLEELKEKCNPVTTIKKIKELCKVFYEKYNQSYGYRDLIHFVVRTCIKHKMAITLYIMGLFYSEIKKRGSVWKKQIKG